MYWQHHLDTGCFNLGLWGHVRDLSVVFQCCHRFVSYEGRAPSLPLKSVDTFLCWYFCLNGSDSLNGALVFEDVPSRGFCCFCWFKTVFAVSEELSFDVSEAAVVFVGFNGLCCYQLQKCLYPERDSVWHAARCLDVFALRIRRKVEPLCCPQIHRSSLETLTAVSQPWWRTRGGPRPRSASCSRWPVTLRNTGAAFVEAECKPRLSAGPLWNVLDVEPPSGPCTSSPASLLPPHASTHMFRVLNLVS